MVKALDLDDQEQLESVKAFWSKWGTPIVAVITVVMVGWAAYMGWQWRERSQAAEAEVVFAQVEAAAIANDADKAQRYFDQLKASAPGQVWTAQAGLLVAATAVQSKKNAVAQQALQWVAQSPAEAAYRDVAQLRLAALLAEQKQFEPALTALTAVQQPVFKGVVHDLRGDILMLQNKSDAAGKEWLAAWQAMVSDEAMRNIIAAKMSSVGVAVPQAPEQNNSSHAAPK